MHASGASEENDMPDDRTNDREQPTPAVQVENEDQNAQDEGDRTTQGGKTDADVRADEAINDRFQATDN
jgi:hypothetical protein